MKNKNFSKNLFAILLISFSGAIIYGLPYFASDYYDAYLSVFKLTDQQFANLGSLLGIFGAISYLFGGFVADKISIRKLISLSLIGTALGGILHLIKYDYYTLVFIYSLWGITSLFAFWPACVKAIRLLSDSENQGKVFGIFEGGRGIFAAVSSTVAAFTFAFISNRISDYVGIRGVIIFYIIIDIVAGILVFSIMKDDKIESSERTIVFSDIFKVLKMPSVWIIAIITMCIYTFTMAYGYFTPYSTQFLGLSVAMGASIASARRYVSTVSSVGGGFLTDKFGISKVFFVSFVIVIAGILAIFSLPLSKTMAIPYIIIFFVTYFFFNINYSLSWAMMDEGNIPADLSGTAAGIISTIGYLPEIFVYQIAARFIDSENPSAQGFKSFFYIIIGFLVIGAIFAIIWQQYIKKLNKKQAI